MNHREVMQQALEALEVSTPKARNEDDYAAQGWKEHHAAIDALRAALEEPQITHSAECWKWHHKCAIAEVERLKLFCEEMLSELYVYRASKYLKDVTAAFRARGEK